MSNGEEPEKGPRLIKETHQLLQQSGLNFIGNVEGFDTFTGKMDVLVMDGFTGNVALKLSEGLTEGILRSMKEALDRSLAARLTKPFWGPPLKAVAKQWDTTSFGGAPLLGVNGNVIIGHGRSKAADIANGIQMAVRMVQEQWLTKAVPRNLPVAAAHQNH
jgi:glycerol-3-phosphate acyltransferase PlsX